MSEIVINGKVYERSEEYNFERSAWITSLDDDTKSLVLDFTIMWNMVEHKVYDDNFKKSEIDKCINKIVENKDYTEKIDKLIVLLKEYLSIYVNEELIYAFFKFRENDLAIDEFTNLYNSGEKFDVLYLLMLFCYRIRCNLFHGLKAVRSLNDQKMLFFCMNEFLSTIMKTYYI